jgi:hypothetical protein
MASNLSIRCFFKFVDTIDIFVITLVKSKRYLMSNIHISFNLLKCKFIIIKKEKAMEEKVVKKCAGKPAGKAAPKAKSSCGAGKKCATKSAGAPTKCSKPAGKPCEKKERKTCFPKNIVNEDYTV